jgi:LAO/AO transport system kinase
LNNPDNIKPNAWNKNYQVSLKSVQDVRQLAQEIIKGNRLALAQGITLAESTHPKDGLLRVELLESCLPYSGKSLRIGITGIPGAGKSTFIEALGMHLCNRGEKIAVLAVDPSSAKSGGSILGDKTRMTALSVNENAFIRPSPGGDSPGGIAAHTREAMLLCEAAGFEIVLIETVGVGQSETWVRSISDMFILLTVPNTGDELQGIKRGIMEMADLIIINKCDGMQIENAHKSLQQLKSASHLFPYPDSKVQVEVLEVSSLENTGIDNAWNHIQQFFSVIEKNGWKNEQRKTQEEKWLHSLLNIAWLRMLKDAIPENEWRLMRDRVKNDQGSIYREVYNIISRIQSKFKG